MFTTFSLRFHNGSDGKVSRLVVEPERHSREQLCDYLGEVFRTQQPSSAPDLRVVGYDYIFEDD